MAQAKAVRVRRRFVAVGAEEIPFQIRAQLTALRRRAGAEPEARLASVQRHLVGLMLARLRTDGNQPRIEDLVADAVHAGTLVAPYRVELGVAAKRDRGIAAGQLEGMACVRACDAVKRDERRRDEELAGDAHWFVLSG
ncbi:MAG TPA: hypothetical protein VE935_00855 [Burkholderiales bacterium]|nr:hypothetical protein [Burkholderiales bacterium]